MKINEKWLKIANDVEKELYENGVFAKLENIAFANQMRVMDAFREFQVSESHFCPTTGYGYDDRGRDTLEEIFARVFETEDAIVRHNIISGTQALCIGLFGILRTGDTMFSVTGKPYDTLDEVIGLRGEGMGSLKDYGINYKEIAMAGEDIDIE
jgi:cystathionine beta-lyase family protein involved in aluminum resistance